jgi:hypothetical protein
MIFIWILIFYAYLCGGFLTCFFNHILLYSMRADFIPNKDALFAIWILALTKYLDSKLTLFGIPEDPYNELGIKMKRWNVLYTLSMSNETRTKSIVSAKNNLRKEIEKDLRAFVNEYIRYNHLIKDEDRKNMSIPVRSETRTPVPVPDTIPAFRIELSVIRRLNIHFRDITGNSRGKPAGVHGVEIKWAVLDTPPESADLLANSSFDTRSPMMLSFTDAQRGKNVYLCLRWENTRGEKGPWSEIAMAIVP